MKQAIFSRPDKDKFVGCLLCCHYCRIADGAAGVCGVRDNRGGVLYSRNYGQVAAANVDPVEKKPLYHFYPGTWSYSIACVGCNFRCDFCQNWQISQKEEAKKMGLRLSALTPAQVVDEAILHKCKSISYTYTEPAVYFEFAADCARLAKEKGLKNIFVTNGYLSPDAIEYISPYLDAVNVDIKAFSESFYKQYCGARLYPVLENIKLMRKLGIWVEITTLVIPGRNDSEKELSGIAEYIAGLDRDIPWHLSRFHPDYKATEKEFTSTDILKKAYSLARKAGLRYIYIGNVRTEQGETTFCPSCGRPVIERLGFSVQENKVKDGKCGFCSGAIAGIGL